MKFMMNWKIEMRIVIYLQNNIHGNSVGSALWDYLSDTYKNKMSTNWFTCSHFFLFTYKELK